MSSTTVLIPTLETERFVLRAPKPADFEAYAAFCAGPRSHGVGGPYTRDRAFGQFCALVGHWHIRGYGRWIVAARGDDTALGIVGPFYPEGWLEPEIAWSLFDGHEGKGVATEAARAALAYAYGSLGWTTAVSLVMPGNARSEAVAARLGAVREGVYHHDTIGPLDVWRHAPPEARRAGRAA